VGADANGVKRVRLDSLVVERGLAGSRERARALILAGQVAVDGQVVSKAGASVGAGSDVRLLQPDHPYVGRGGLKLAHALDAFGIDPRGWRALDVGASTGGFTDVMLQRGAATVLALDVGHGQLDWKLRTDPRVVVLERVNARTLTADQLPDRMRSFDVITVDVSFISLRQVLPPLAPLLEPGGHLVLLVKPQFEAGRAEVGKGGIVKDPLVHARVVEEVADAASKLGLTRAGDTPSPIAGAEGNREFFLHLRRSNRGPGTEDRGPIADS
jgi:23S rRNA (cytidine1920-2'-O)/16S rRNA (cytidine1409-2'-O)-methyltransferase